MGNVKVFRCSHGCTVKAIRDMSGNLCPSHRTQYQFVREIEREPDDYCKHCGRSGSTT